MAVQLVSISLHSVLLLSKQTLKLLLADCHTELLLLYTALELVLRLLVMLYLTLVLQLMLVTHSLLMEAQSTTLSEPNLLV